MTLKRMIHHDVLDKRLVAPGPRKGLSPRVFGLKEYLLCSLPPELPLIGSKREVKINFALNRLGTFSKSMTEEFIAFRNAPPSIDDDTYGVILNRQERERLIDVALFNFYKQDAIAGYAPPQYLPGAEYAGMLALLAAKNAGIIPFVPRVLVRSRGELTYGRLIPYAPVHPIVFLENATSPLMAITLLDLFHEIGHYVYWNGMYDGVKTFQEWAAEHFGTAPRELVDPTTHSAQTDPAWNESQFEELFCDIFAIAVGGPLVVLDMLEITELQHQMRTADIDQGNTVIRFANYPTKPIRSEVIERTVVKFFSDFTPVVERWREVLGATLGDDTTEGQPTVVTAATEILEHLSGVGLKGQALEQGPLSALMQTPITDVMIDFRDPESARDAISEAVANWYAALPEEGEAEHLIEQVLKNGEHPDDFPDAAALIAEWKNNPPPLLNPNGPQKGDWYPVFHADGWGTIGTKTVPPD